MWAGRRITEKILPQPIFLSSQSDKRIRDLEARATSLESDTTSLKTRMTNAENKFGSYYTAAQVNSKLGNYYTKSETYKRTEVDTRVSSSGGYTDFTRGHQSAVATNCEQVGGSYGYRIYTYTMPADGVITLPLDGVSSINGVRVPNETYSCYVEGDADSPGYNTDCTQSMTGKVKKGDVIKTYGTCVGGTLECSNVWGMVNRCVPEYYSYHRLQYIAYR